MPMPPPPPPQQGAPAPPPPGPAAGAGAGAGGMLAQAAQAAAAVPPPGAQAEAQQISGGQDLPGMPVPNAVQTVPPGSPEELPGQPVDVMPETGQAYQGEDVALNKEDATEAEEKEYQRVYAALQKVLYEQDTIADAVMKQLDPNDKISTTTKAATLLVQQLDEKLDMDEVVIPQITQDAVEVVAELAENRFGLTYSEQDLTATLGATWEGVMAIFGVDEREYNQMVDEYGPQMDKLQKSYDGFLAQGKPAPKPGGEEAAPPPPQAAAAPPAAVNPGAPPVPMA